MTMVQIREKLQAGEVVICRLHGNSMTPIIHSGDTVTIEPIPLGPSNLRKGDIVFCKVRGSYFLHKVTAVRVNQVQIGNNKGHINGWTKRENVFGKFVRVNA